MTIPVTVTVEAATPHDAWYAALNYTVEALKKLSGPIQIPYSVRGYTPSKVVRLWPKDSPMTP